jgi:cbb3-type cytochrome oxidase subunit 3
MLATAISGLDRQHPPEERTGMDTIGSFIYMIVLIVLFGAIVFWAFRRKHKERFEEDGRIPFREKVANAAANAEENAEADAPTSDRSGDLKGATAKGTPRPES